MKRELKLRYDVLPVMREKLHCRAYPDEKGIETSNAVWHFMQRNMIAEPIPMKRELKHRDEQARYSGLLPDCRAYPDEKGIETEVYSGLLASGRSPIAEPIPMKRELKPYRVTIEPRG